MYPRNAASPERVSIGAVVQISDGAVQSSGVTVRVLPFGGSEADGGGTTAYSTDGVVVYTPTQAETNYTSFVLIAKKTGCIPASVTVVTSESSVSGRVYVQTNGDKTGYTATVSDKTGFKLASDGLAQVTSWTVAITGNLTGNVTGSVGSISGVTFPANFGSLDITVGGAIGELGPSALAANDLYSPIAVRVWDEVLTGATHNIASSAGRRLRQLASVIVRAGTAQGPGTGNNQIQLDADASATNGEYDPGLIFIETGTGAGQARLILQYNGSTKVATVDRDWRINPDNTSEFVILADAGRNSVNEGLAQGGTSTTITLNASASASDDAYNGQLVFIRSGTGQDQVGLIEDYVGSTKVATIRTRSATGQWATVPDTTSAYMMIPNLTFTLSEISGAVADGVWDEPTSGHTTAGTTGKALIDSGAAGNPWSTDLSTGYSGTQAGNILNEVKVKTDTITTPIINVYPVSASTPERVQGTTLTFYRNESRSVSVVTDFTLTSLTLQFTVEDADGVDVYTLANGSISRSSQTFTVAVTTAVTGNLGQYRWSMRDISGGGSSVIAMGVLTVQEAASNV
jgi:hypothetical protein